MKKGNTITYNDLTRMISEAIGESNIFQQQTISGMRSNGFKTDLRDKNGNQRGVKGLNNTQMFQNYLKDIGIELAELMEIVERILSQNANNRQAYKDQKKINRPKKAATTQQVQPPITESRIEQSVRNILRRFINEELQASGDNNVQGDNANSQNNEASILDGLIQTLSLVKQNGGNFNGLSDEQLRVLFDQLKKTYSQANRQVNGTNGYGDFDFNQQYNNQWRTSYYDNRINRLLTDIQRKYLAIYQELRTSALVNESFGTWFRNNTHGIGTWFRNNTQGIRDTWNGVNGILDKNQRATRQINNYKGFYDTLRQTYDGIFGPLKKAMEERSYTNAKTLIQRLMSANRLLGSLLRGNSQQRQQNNQTNSSQNDNDDEPVVTSSGNEPWNNIKWDEEPSAEEIRNGLYGNVVP